MKAYVQLSKTRDHFGSNTQPMPLDDAFAYALAAFENGREVRIYRARDVAPYVTPNELLERHESFITEDLLAHFTPVAG